MRYDYLRTGEDPGAIVLQLLPNALTLLRLLLALPVGWLILREQFAPALAIGLIAGLTDAVDGWLARRLNAYSRFGAALDPIADKTLMFVVFISLAMVGLVPWPVAAVVVVRDLVILAGATAYHGLIDELELEPTALSKSNTFVQIGYCILVLAGALFTAIPEALLVAAALMVVAVSIISGVDYVVGWSRRALAMHTGGSARRRKERD